MAARASIEASAWIDTRYDVLASAIGVDRFSAIGRMALLWSTCTDRETATLRAEFVAPALNVTPSEAVDALVLSELGEVVAENPLTVRIRGCDGRIEWLAKKRKASRKGGASTKRKSKAKKGPSGPPEVEPQPGPPVVPPEGPLTPTLAPAKNSKESSCAREPGSLSVAAALWQEQETLRSQLKTDGVDSGISVTLMPSTSQLKPVHSAVVEYGEDACREALAKSDAEARALGHARFFDGESNWSERAMRKNRQRNVEGARAAGAAKRAREQRQANGGRPPEPTRKIKRLG